MFFFLRISSVFFILSLTTGLDEMCMSPKMNWLDSRAWCQARGGDLISIHSAEENQAVIDFAIEQHGSDQSWGPWIGLAQDEGAAPNYGTSISTYSWSDGTAMDYQATWSLNNLNSQWKAITVILYPNIQGMWADNDGYIAHNWLVGGVCNVPNGNCVSDLNHLTPVTHEPTWNPTAEPTAAQAMTVFNSVSDCPQGSTPSGESRTVSDPVFADGYCFYFLEAHGSSSPESLGENGCDSVVSGAVMPCVADEAFNNVLLSLLEDQVCSKCNADGFAIANGFDSKCTSDYEPSGTSRDPDQCTSMDRNGNWINRCGGYVSSLCVLGTAYETCDSIAADDTGVCGLNSAYDSNFASDTCAGPTCGSMDESTCCSCVCSPETDATAAPSGESCGEFVDRSDSKITGNIVDMRIAFPYYFEGETIRADDDSVIPNWTLDETAMCTHELSKDFFYEDLRDDVGFTLDAFVLYFHLNFAYNFEYEETIEIGGVSYTWPATTLERSLDLTFSIDVPKSRSISVGFNGTDSLDLIVQTFEPTRNPTSQPSIFPTVNPTQQPTANPTLNPTTVPSMYPTIEPTLHPTNPDVEIYSTILEYAGQEVYDYDESSNVRIILTITTITNMPWMLELVSLDGGGILNEDFNQQAVSDCPPGLDLVSFCQTWNIEFDSPPGCDSSAREVELNFEAVAPGGSTGTGEVRVVKAPITINLGSTSSWICVQNLGQFDLTYDVESSVDGSNWVTAPNHEPVVGTFWSLKLSFASDTSDLGVGFVSRFDVSDDLYGPKCTDCHLVPELQFTIVEDGHHAFEVRFFLTPLYFGNAMTHFEIEVSFPDTTPIGVRRRLLSQENEGEVVGMVISLMVGEEAPGMDMPTFTASPTLEPNMSPTLNPTEAPVEQVCVDLKSGHQAQTCATYIASMRMRGEKCEIPALWDNCCASCSALENEECTDNVAMEQSCQALYNAYFPTATECDNPLMYVHCCATCEALSGAA